MKPTADLIKREHRAAEKAMREGRLRDAHQHCLAVLQADRRHADAWFLCGVIAAGNGQHAKAVEILRNAITLSPQTAQYHAELGKEMLALRDTVAARESADTAMQLAPKDVPTMNTLGSIYSHCGEHVLALDCFDKAVRALGAGEKAERFRPLFRAEIFYNRAISLQFAGRFDDAEADYEQSIAIYPTLFSAHSALATLRRQTPESNHLERLQGLRSSVISPADQLHLGHAIAKELEDLERLPESLKSLEWAKAQKAREVNYDPAADAVLFTRIRDLMPAPSGNRQTAKAECNNAEPIFIVGMPRTGTTLVEQILGSHSQVFGAGELNHFPQMVKKHSGSTSDEDMDAETLEMALDTDMAALGQAYIDRTRPRTGHTPRFTDKLPLNFIYAGLIHRALPHAKIICLRRDPMDTCLSNYRQLFAINFRYYFYNLDLLDCGHYYLGFDRLMSHWREVMPGVIHEVQYEELVAAPERVTRELLDFCGLPWEESCLSFNKRKSSVATPSAVQVRQGIYNSSVERWKKYGDAMQPLYKLLSDAGLYD